MSPVLKDLFDLYVDAIKQGTYFRKEVGGEQSYFHSFTSTWEDAWDFFDIESPEVSTAQFDEAVARKWAEIEKS